MRCDRKGKYKVFLYPNNPVVLLEVREKKKYFLKGWLETASLKDQYEVGDETSLKMVVHYYVKLTNITLYHEI